MTADTFEVDHDAKVHNHTRDQEYDAENSISLLLCYSMNET